MDESYSGSDVSMSPTQILDRLHALRKLQVTQRGKLQKQQLRYHQESGDGDNIHELLTQLSESSSYSTFQQLLQENPNLEVTSKSCSQETLKSISQKVVSADLVDGVSVLNLSQESEFLVISPVSIDQQSQTSSKHLRKAATPPQMKLTSKSDSMLLKKQIELDEMPILSPRTDYETLIKEKIDKEQANSNDKAPNKKVIKKKPFLKRGVGLARFGVSKDDLVIQNTKALPWKRKSMPNSNCTSNQDTHDIEPLKPSQIKAAQTIKNIPKKVDIIPIQNSNKNINEICVVPNSINKTGNLFDARFPPIYNRKIEQKIPVVQINNKSNEVIKKDSPKSTLNIPRGPLQPSKNCKTIENKAPVNPKGKTWAAILTQEQDAFLRQLKQSSYYKNFESPGKSIDSDISCDDTLTEAQNAKEVAEQNMFELLENKVTNDSFSIDSSFFHKLFKRKSSHETSGNDTPQILQQCLKRNPQLLRIFPAPETNVSCSEVLQSDTCDSEYLDCDHETCSTASTCSTCKTVNDTNIQTSTPQTKDDMPKELGKPETKSKEDSRNSDNEEIKNKMAEMNAQLLATSDLLKERLHELEDEIEMFRKENSSLSKVREDLDSERQKFYEEKAAFEQKYQEEKVLSEYYLAEEKEKLAKQKQTYDRYMRELRGRLNKKEKDEVSAFKKEIECLKEEIRTKDAKSTACIARLRNQVKNLENEKKVLHDESEKLKVQNRRIQQTNTTTRRLSNIKYLQEINRKLALLGNRATTANVYVDDNAKYISEEILKNKNKRKPEIHLRTRAKSVPNLNVTSRYAKYFSQRDSVSQQEDVQCSNSDNSGDIDVDVKSIRSNIQDYRLDEKNYDSEHYSDQEENNIEKLYLATFSSQNSDNPRSNLAATSFDDITETGNEFFIRKTPISSASSYRSKSSSVIQKQTNEKQDKTQNSISRMSNRSISPDSQTFRPVSPRHSKSSSRHSLESQKSSSSSESTNRLFNQSQTPNDKSISQNRMTRSPNDRLISHSQMSNRSRSPNDIPISYSQMSSKSNGSTNDRSNSDSQRSRSPIDRHISQSRLSIKSNDGTISRSRKSSGSKSPISILSNKTTSTGHCFDLGRDNLSFTDEDLSHNSTSRDLHTWSKDISRSNLNPREIKQPDGSKELRFPNGNMKYISADGNYSKFFYYNGDIKESFYTEGRIKYYYAETKTYHTTFIDGLEVFEFSDGQLEKRYKDGSIEIHLPNGTIRYTDPKNSHVSEEWRFPDGIVLTKARNGEQVVRFPNGQIEIHTKDHKRREFPDGTVKLVYTDGTSETRYSSGRIRVKDKSGALIMDSAANR